LHSGDFRSVATFPHLPRRTKYPTAMHSLQKKKLTVDDVVFNVHSRWTVFCFKYDRNDGGTASMSAVMFIVVISTGCYTLVFPLSSVTLGRTTIKRCCLQFMSYPQIQRQKPLEHLLSSLLIFLYQVINRFIKVLLKFLYDFHFPSGTV